MAPIRNIPKGTTTGSLTVCCLETSGTYEPAAAELVGAAGTPDKMYGVMGEEGVPVNLSAHWEYRPPKIRIVDPGTGKSPDSLHVWFSPNDRVERVTLDFGK